MIGEREGTILEMLVREYIRTAEPVSSEKIAKRMRNALSPATVRSIFTDLTDAGFIEQPHTSGGRVPCQKGYRFFVDMILDDSGRTGSVPGAVERMIAQVEDDYSAMRSLQNMLARHFHVLSRFEDFAPVGFEEVFREPEFQESDLIRKFGRFLDEFEGVQNRYSEELTPNSFEVYIGDENNIQPIANVSMIVAKDNAGRLFFMAGPARMYYDRIIPTMRLWHKKPAIKNHKKT